MVSKSRQTTRRSAAELFEKLWPNLRLLGLGIILAWIHLEADFVSSLAGISPDGSIMTSNGIWLFGGLFLAYVAFAVFREPATRLLDRRGMSVAVFVLCVLGAVCIILAFAGTPATSGSTGAKALFAAGVLFLGIIEALTLIQCARLYLPLEPGEVLFFSLMAQLLVFVLYNVFNSYSQYVVWNGGPAFSSLLGLCLLPPLAWWCMGAPGGRESAQSAGTAETGGEGAGPGYTSDRNLRDHLRLPFAERASLSPSFRLLLLTIFIITGTMSTTLNALMSAQPPTDYLFDAQLAMLIRFVIVLVLFVACLTVAKRLPLEKVFWVGAACIAAAPALLLVLGISTSVLVLVATDALFLLDFFIWVVLILAAQTKGKNALLLFVLGQAAACAGIIVGTVLGAGDGVGAFLAGNRLAGACLMLLVVLATALLFSEQRIREILGSIAKDGVSVREVLDKTAAETALPPTRKATLWADACRTVGERALLSEREQEVLRQLADNRTPQDIADHLYISLHTVRTHTKNIYAKLGVHSRDELIALIRKEYEALK